VNTTPSNLRAEALSILAEIPHTFIALANADNELSKLHFIDSLRDVHRFIAHAFGEPRPVNIGVMQATDDLTRWVSVWTWHPYAERWVSQLRHINHIGSEAA
jgi:hypothetical protein